MKTWLWSGCLFLGIACQTAEEPTAEVATPATVAAVGAAEAVAVAAVAAPSATAVVGKPAPEFTLKDQDGKDVSLASLRGKKVVLEWFNPECPFVVYAHGEGPLKAMAKTHEAKGDLVWLAINSGAPGKQGTGVELNRAAQKTWGMQHRVLFDETGAVGKLYGAKTTPHMYVIDAAGTLVYNGALDNAPLGELRDPALRAYTEGALTAVTKGQPVDPSETTPYGCSVKYLN